MRAFRGVALTYAVAVVLIAPASIAADTLVPEDVEPVVEQAVPPASPERSATDPAVEADPEPEPAGEPPASAGEREADEPEPARRPLPSEEGREDRGPVATVAASGTVTISDFKFSPATITVNVGDTVTWNNAGPTVHTATANDGSFDTGILNKGESGSATFSKAGTISYICTPHPNMKGTVVVQAASAAPDDGGSTGGDSEPVATVPDRDGGGLPATGGETLAIALLGLAVLGTGLVLRRRASA